MLLMACMIYGIKTWLSTLGTVSLVNRSHTNMGRVTVWDESEQLRITSALVVTTLSASIERLAWRKCSERVTNSVGSHNKMITL